MNNKDLKIYLCLEDLLIEVKLVGMICSLQGIFFFKKNQNSTTFIFCVYPY